MIPALLLATGALASGSADSVSYVDSSIELEGEHLEHRFLDLDGDGRVSLILALRLPDGQRELRVHEPRGRGFAPEPSKTVHVQEDVVGWTVADVRPDAGRELVFLTRTGAWSYSLLFDGLRGNIRRLATFDLLFDVPDDHALSYWGYVIPAKGGDLVLLPGLEGFGVFRPRAGQVPEDFRQPTYELASDFTTVATVPSRVGPSDAEVGEEAAENRTDIDTTVELGSNGQFRVITGVEELFLPSEGQHTLSLLSAQSSYRAPAIADVNRDGWEDLILLERKTLRVHLGGPKGPSAKPDRVESFPTYLEPEDNVRMALELVDLDGDGDPDILATLMDRIESFENVEIRLLVLLNDGRRLLPAKPSQVMRFEGGFVRVEVNDANHDGRPDLALRKFELPTLLETVTGLEFRMTHLLYLGQRKGRPFERKPALKQTETFDETTVGDMVAMRHIQLDCDGDKRPDLVEIDLAGRIAIRRLGLEKSMFGAQSWSIDETPWRRFEGRGDITSLDVLDLNADRLGDIVTLSDRSLLILVSSKGR